MAQVVHTVTHIIVYQKDFAALMGKIFILDVFYRIGEKLLFLQCKGSWVGQNINVCSVKKISLMV